VEPECFSSRCAWSSEAQAAGLLSVLIRKLEQKEMLTNPIIWWGSFLGFQFKGNIIRTSGRPGFSGLPFLFLFGVETVGGALGAMRQRAAPMDLLFVFRDGVEFLEHRGFEDAIFGRLYIRTTLLFPALPTSCSFWRLA
jgi:hypothetical protein